ncbi:MAG TPA: sn-glycerol-3-phosphate ABC transporter ATP-binding protein UgpC [Gaiellaceae bacterium]|nr:sn-glycerol-3-phosphate ABC transporter ATP-binding protein UgpC [Gaiellaceae bacterium]
MADVALQDVTKVFDDGTRAVDGLDLQIGDGEFMVLVGPSGCGKTTALRMVAGLEEISDGVVRIGQRVVNDLTPKRRDIAMVFQSYALYPHLSVFDNMAFPLKLAKVPKQEIRRRVETAAKTLDLEPYLGRKPRALSGGQRQRVAMGRAIVREPAAFLMDEPLSNLDAKLRVQMRADIKKLQNELAVTTIYVTHDQVEAMTMGDQVAVLRKGKLQQVAPPQELYDRPVNMFVAGFIGSPAMNMVEARIERRAGELAALVGDREISLDRRHAFLAPWAGRDVVLGVRPEDLEDAAFAPAGGPRIRARVELREALGSEVLVHITAWARPAMTDEMRELAEDMGEDLRPAEHASLVGRFSPRTQVAAGEEIDVALDQAALHFFDPKTGLAVR